MSIKCASKTILKISYYLAKMWTMTKWDSIFGTHIHLTKQYDIRVSSHCLDPCTVELCHYGVILVIARSYQSHMWSLHKHNVVLDRDKFGLLQPIGGHVNPIFTSLLHLY